MVPEFRFLPACLDLPAQRTLLAAVQGVLAEAPLYRATMPKSGRPLSVEMSNCGPLGWYSDRGGYRYTPVHPQTGRPWPAIPASIRDLWHRVANYPRDPECCLINFYRGPARMGLHQDKDEADFAAPVVSISLGDTAIFRIGGTTRTGGTRSLRLASGDVVVLEGNSRLAHHGVDRILPGSSTLVPSGGRFNLTLRCVTPAK